MRFRPILGNVDFIVIGPESPGSRQRAISRRAAQVVVLEARDRIGGRVHTVRPRGWPVPLELGPSSSTAGHLC